MSMPRSVAADSTPAAAPVSQAKKEQIMETERDVNSCAVWSVWSCFATMTLILGVVGDAQIQPYNEDVLGTSYIYNVRAQRVAAVAQRGIARAAARALRRPHVRLG